MIHRGPHPHPAPGSLVQVAFLTGQSRPPSCALSPLQAAFLRRLAEATRVQPIEVNYPYRDSGEPWKPTALFVASLRNGWQFLRARAPSSARVRNSFVVRALVEQAAHTVFLCGSCGLELLSALELPSGVLARCSYVAYGPVARSLPACAGVVVRGRRDWVARPFGIRADHEIECGHLDTLESDAFFEICTTFIHEERKRIVARDHAAAF